MKNSMIILLFAYVVLLNAMLSTSFAQRDANNKKQVLNENLPLDLNFENKSLFEIVENIQKQANVKIIVESDLSQKLTLKLENIALIQALQIIAKQLNCELKKSARANIYWLIPPPKLIHLEFQDKDIKEAILEIVNLAEAKICCFEEFSGKVSLKFENIPWPLALESIVKSVNPEYESVVLRENVFLFNNKIWKDDSEKELLDATVELREVFGRKYSPKKEFLDPIKEYWLRKKLKPEKGLATETRVFGLKYIEVVNQENYRRNLLFSTELEEALEKALTKNIGMIFYDEPTNSIIVSDIRINLDQYCGQNLNNQRAVFADFKKNRMLFYRS